MPLPSMTTNYPAAQDRRVVVNYPSFCRRSKTSPPTNPLVSRIEMIRTRKDHKLAFSHGCARPTADISDFWRESRLSGGNVRAFHTRLRQAKYREIVARYQ